MINQVLVIGGAGYLGAAVVESLKQLETNFTVFDNLSYVDTYLDNVPFVRGDLRNKELLSDLIKSHNSVIWLGALVGDFCCDIDKGLTKSINQTPLEWYGRNFPDKPIVFSSTCSVMGAQPNAILTEDSPTLPLSTYAETKLGAEIALQKCSRAFIYRLGTLYGLNSKLGRIRSDLVLNTMTMKAVQSGYLTLYGGEEWRPLLCVRDIADFVAHTSISDLMPGTYNLAYGNYQVKDIARKVAEYTGAEIIYKPQPSKDLRNYRVSTEKARKVLGFSPQIPLEIGIAEIARITKEGRIRDINSFRHSNQLYMERILGDKSI